MVTEEDFASEDVCSGQWTIQRQHTVRYYSPTQISLQTYDRSYTGGAHGIYDYGGQCFLLRNGQARGLSLSDFSRRGSGFARRLSDLCIADLRRRGASYVPEGKGARLKLDDLANFQVGPRGLTIIFNPYTMGGYAEGGYWVEVPWKRIRDLLGDMPEIRRWAGLSTKRPEK